MTEWLAYYDFVILFSLFVLLPMYAISSFRSMVQEKQRQETMRKAMECGCE